MNKVSLKHYEKKLLVRPLELRDWNQIVELSRRCFPEIETSERAQFQSQLAIFPEGQIGVEYQGKLVASSSSLILDFEPYREGHSWDEISDNGFIRNHKPEGSTLYGIEIMVDPAHQGLNVNIIGGSQFTLEDDELFSIAYLFRRDGTLGKQYKLHITPSERNWWEKILRFFKLIEEKYRFRSVMISNSLS